MASSIGCTGRGGPVVSVCALHGTEEEGHGWRGVPRGQLLRWPVICRARVRRDAVNGVVIGRGAGPAATPPCRVVMGMHVRDRRHVLICKNGYHLSIEYRVHVLIDSTALMSVRKAHIMSLVEISGHN